MEDSLGRNIVLPDVPIPKQPNPTGRNDERSNPLDVRTTLAIVKRFPARIKGALPN